MQRLLLFTLFLLLGTTGLRAQCNVSTSSDLCNFADANGVISGTIILCSGQGQNPNVVTIPTTCNGQTVSLGNAQFEVRTNATLVIPEGTPLDVTADMLTISGDGNATATLTQDGTTTTYQANGGSPDFNDLTTLIQEQAVRLPVELLGWSALPTAKGDAVLLE